MRNLIPTSRSAPRRGRSLLAAFLPFAVLATLLAMPAVANAQGEAPPLQVTVDPFEQPRYGDDLSFTVRSTGIEQVATVSFGDEVLASKALTRGSARFAIPTLGRFKAGVEYRLRVDVTSETSEGQSQLTVKPWFIGSKVTVASTTLSYSAPLFGDLVPDRATVVEPSGGLMEMHEGATQRATYAIRPDGTFALNDVRMTPGLYRVHVYYAGDESYSRNFPTSGSFVGDITIVPMPTTTVAGVSASSIEQGQPVSVLASAKSADANTVADVRGDIVVTAARVGSQDFVEIARASYPGGNQALPISLQEWAAERSGAWTIRVSHSGTDISAPSAATDLTLTIAASGAEATTTELALASNAAIAHGVAVGASAKVTADDGSEPSGEVAFLVDGKRVATAAVRPDGTAAASIPPGSTGTRSVTAVYLGNDEHGGSTSTAQRLTVAKAATSTSVTVPSSVVAGSTVRVQVSPVSSAARPGGILTVTERGRAVTATRVSAGVGTFRVPALSVGTHSLTVAYAGDADTAPSSRTVQVRVTKSVSRTTAAISRLKGRKMRVTVKVAAGRPVTGKVRVTLGKRTVAARILRATSRGRAVLVTKRLPAGKRRLVVRYAGSRDVRASTSRAYTVRVR